MCYFAKPLCDLVKCDQICVILACSWSNSNQHPNPKQIVLYSWLSCIWHIRRCEFSLVNKICWWIQNGCYKLWNSLKQLRICNEALVVTHTHMNIFCSYVIPTRSYKFHFKKKSKTLLLKTFLWEILHYMTHHCPN